MRLLEMFATSVLYAIPFFLLGYFPIRQELLIPRKKLIPAAIGIYLFCLCLTLYDFWQLYRSPGVRILISFLIYIGIAILCSMLARQNLAFFLFLVFVLKNYTDNVRLAAEFVIEKFSLSASSTLLLEYLILIITLTSLYFPMRRYLNPILKQKLTGKFWGPMCLIPIGAFFLFRVAIQPDYLGLTTPQLPILIILLWPTSCFFSYFTVLRTYVTTVENDQLTRKIRNAELVGATKSEQFDRSIMRYRETESELEQMVSRLESLQEALRAEDGSQAESLLNQWTEQLVQLSERRFCENRTINGLVSQYNFWASQYKIEMLAHLELPEKLRIPETDLLIVMGNLLENALEACNRQTVGRRFLKINASAANQGPILISVFNSYSGSVMEKNGVFSSSKRKNSSGFGIASVQAVANQYDGYARFQFKDGIFEASVLLNTPAHSSDLEVQNDA